MYVYRIQRDGLGPYRQENDTYNYTWTRRQSHKNGSPKHPTIYEDMFAEEQIEQIVELWEDEDDHVQDVLFGFTSIKQLKEWFTSWEISNLRDMGFEVVRVKAERVIHNASTKQCVFVIDRSVPPEVIVDLDCRKSFSSHAFNEIINNRK